MKNSILSGIFFFLLCTAAFGQREVVETDNPRFMDRVYFGGGGNFQLTQDIFLVGVSPLAGYMITDRWSSGLGVTYQYARFQLINRPPLATHTYGGRVFSRYNIFRSVYTMGEYEMLNMQLPSLSSDLPRRWVDRLLLGGGYFQPLGRRAGFNIGIFYDFLYRAGDIPYNSPWVYRVGFTF